MNDVAFRIRAYAAYGELIMETVHSTETSASIEIEAWQKRMWRGEAIYAELIDCRPGGRLTNLRIHEDTNIPWSWIK